MALGLCAANLSFGQLTPRESDLFSQGLKLGNLTPDDLDWPRWDSEDRDTLPFLPRSVQEPWTSANALSTLNTDAKQASFTLLLMQLQSGIFEEKWPQSSSLAAVGEVPSEVPGKLAAPVLRLANAIRLADQEISAATSALSPEERRQVIEGLPQVALEYPEFRIDFARMEPLGYGALFDLLRRVDLPRIRAAAANLSRSTDDAMRDILKLGDRSKLLQKQVGFKVGEVVVHLLPASPDVYASSNAQLVIDLGGSDRYTGRIGGGAGNAAVFLDFDGDDYYNTKDLSVGGGVLGIGIARDLWGNDTYRGASVTLGAGLAGVGLFADTAGDDEYRSGVLAQGYGQFGVGIAIDVAGNDYWDLKAYGQGSARTMGVGMLIDRTGRDIYRAGGLILNSPLFSDVHYSFAQGFGSGYREDVGGASGGLGLLFDYEGDDAYLAETYAQAASYWKSCGVLIDSEGNDVYRGYHYAQSSAMHVTSAYLMDFAGDDIYGMHFGASHALGHDFGLAFLLDRAGNDNYFGRDSAPGSGNANGLGIFLEVAGDDRYMGPAGRGNGARGTGSFGFFVDGTGGDLYSAGLADGQAALESTWGVRYDLVSPPLPREQMPDRTDAPVPGSQGLPGSTELERLYKLATQWSVGAAQAEVERSLNTLISIGMPAFEWMLESKLKGADRLQLRAYSAMVRALGEPARLALALKVARGNTLERRGGLVIAVDAGVTEVSASLAPLLTDPVLQIQAIRASGSLKSRDSVAGLIPLTVRRDSVGVAAIVALAQIGDESAYSTAEALLASGNLPVRKASMQLMSLFPLRALSSARVLMLEGDERKIRLGVELLGMIGSDEALSEASSRLLDPTPGVRIQALLALNGRCPLDARERFLSLQSDPDPGVRAVAKRVETGR